MAEYVALSCELGGGRFQAGWASGFGYLLLWSAPLLLIAFLVMFLASGLRWLIGVRASAVLVSCLVSSGAAFLIWQSQPMQKFRRLVWPAAPASLRIAHYDLGTSFGDGWSHSFTLVGDARTAAEICRVAHLTPVQDPSRFIFDLPHYVSRDEPYRSRETRIYRDDIMYMAWRPSQSRMWVVLPLGAVPE